MPTGGNLFCHRSVWTVNSNDLLEVTEEMNLRFELNSTIKNPIYLLNYLINAYSLPPLSSTGAMTYRIDCNERIDTNFSYRQFKRYHQLKQNSQHVT